jgi:hypothetical protein
VPLPLSVLLFAIARSHRSSSSAKIILDCEEDDECRRRPFEAAALSKAHWPRNACDGLSMTFTFQKTKQHHLYFVTQGQKKKHDESL